jgi:hypothetical protein
MTALGLVFLWWHLSLSRMVSRTGSWELGKSL